MLALLITHNFGKSWKQRGELPERNIIKQIVWIDASHVAINASNNGHGKIFYSCDGGRKFEITLNNTAASNGIVWDTASGHLYAIDNLNRFYVSYTKGRTWQGHGSRIPFEQRPNVSHFCSLTSFKENGRQDIFATSSYPGQIFRTRDTGRHWQRVFSDSIFYRNREIPMMGKLRDGRFLAVSAQGTVDEPGGLLIGSRTSHQWKNVPTPEGLWAFAEDPFRPGFIVAGGFGLGRRPEDAAAFWTNDYGLSWHPKPLLGAILVWQIEFLAPHSWILATDMGLVELNISSLN